MKFEVINVSIVVAVEKFSPVYMQTGYLQSWNIVPRDWIPTDPPIATPLGAAIQYPNGMNFVAQQDKIQITDLNPPPEDPGSSETQNYMLQFLQKLPSEISYTAVGINLVGFLEHPDANAYLLHKFIKPGTADTETDKAEATNLRFMYSVPKARLVLYLDGGTIQRPPDGAGASGLIVSSNYHTDIKKKTLRETKGVINRFADRCSHFVSLSSQLLELN